MKEGEEQYLLSLHNVSDGPLTVGYYDMRNLLHSQRIKIISWANRREISPCVLQRNGYLDIRFQFKIFDLNFKFLTFQLVVNEALQDLVLPVTLLDVC